jgi:hypothetical protein
VESRGIITEEGELLHHLYGQPSCITPYARGYFKDRTMICVRHKDLPKEINHGAFNHNSPLWRSGARFGRVHKLAVQTSAEAVKALCINLDGLEDYLMNAKKTA